MFAQRSSPTSASSRVEQAFRLVDRGDYISGFPPTKLYRPDQTLRKTDDTYAHLSAPCIYAKVVEALDVQEGWGVEILSCEVQLGSFVL